MDAINGTGFERAIVESQIREAITEISRLKAEVASLKEDK